MTSKQGRGKSKTKTTKQGRYLIEIQVKTMRGDGGLSSVEVRRRAENDMAPILKEIKKKFGDWEMRVEVVELK